MIRKPQRTTLAPTAFAVMAISIMIALIVPLAARAADGTEAMGFITAKKQCGPFQNLGYYQAQDGAVSFCMDQQLPGPGSSMKTYDKGWTWVNDAYAAVVHNGYPATTTIGGIALGEEDARAATQIAVWMVSGTTKRDGSYSYSGYGGTSHSGTFAGQADITRAARWLYDGATSGTLKAPHNRTKRYASIYDAAIGSERQNMLYVMPTVEVTVKKTSARAEITSSNGSYSLAGAAFDIFDASSGSKVASITTGAKGSATCNLSPNKRYYLMETKAPRGFVTAGERVEFSTDSQNSTVSVANQPATARITVVKRDAATEGSAQPGATLAGAEFLCTSLSVPGWEQRGTTDIRGTLTFQDVPLGEAEIVETKAPEGYLIDTQHHRVTASADDMNGAGIVELSCTVDDTPISCDLEISKFKDTGGNASGLEEPASGVRFDIVSNTTGTVVGSITTNAYGFADTASMKDAWFGTGKRPAHAAGALPYDRAGYTVREDPSTVPEGFKRAGDWTVPATSLVNGAKLQYIVDNHAVTTHLQIVKIDSDSGAVVPLSGFSFQILNKDKQPISQDCWYPNYVKLDTFTTDKSGKVTLPEGLKPGTYYLRETAAQKPYLIDANELEVIIPSDGTLPPACIVTYSDKAATGGVRIAKYEKGNQERRLSGATFDVIAQEDISTPDGRIQAVKGQVMATLTTDVDGCAQAHGLPLGNGTAHYALKETKAPDGYLVDPSEHPFTLSYKDEATAEVAVSVKLENDFTKVDLSKTDITGKQEVPGAKLRLTKKDGTSIDTWTSTDKPHRIEHLAPGNYVLIEEMTPQAYDQAERVEFEIKATGTVQKVTMKDAPIEITAQVDKRQEIARPTAARTVANGDGANKAATSLSETGDYRYTIDARNDSDTWVDEFTVEDDLAPVKDGLAKLVSVTTPQAYGDYDGRCNVWYRTNKTADESPTSDANATKDDGHDNPWLADDGRKIDYTGWRLWKRDIDTGKQETLQVSELSLDVDEEITGIRFEYGRVEAAFTTRDDEQSWSRETVKDVHDDIESKDIDSAEAKPQTSDAEKLVYRPAVMHLRVTEDYQAGSVLKNQASVFASRNGGGEKLESRDEDHVEQVPGAAQQQLPQTGALVGGGTALLLSILGVLGLYARKCSAR